MVGKSNTYATVDLSGKQGGAKIVIKVADTEIPASMFSMNYSLNSIPTATAAVPLGRDARTGKPSAVYSIAKDLKQMAPVVVTLVGSLGDWAPAGLNAAKQQFPRGEFVLFTGYIAGTSYRRSNGSIALVLSLVNTLVDLALSSCGSRDAVPGAPHDLMLPILHQDSGAKTYMDAASRFISELPIAMNLDIAEGLLTVLTKIAKDNLIQATSAWCNSAPPSALVDNLLSNTRALQAISGVLEWKGFINLLDNNQPTYVKDYPFEVDVNAKQALSKSIGNRLNASFAGTSMWHTLIGSLLPDIGLSVVPLTDSAIIAPAFEMAREAGAVIWTSDVADMHLSVRSQRPLFGVGVMHEQHMGSLPAQSKQCVGGSYTASLDGVVDGMWLFVPAPDWLSAWDSLDDNAVNGNGSVNNLLTQVVNTAVGSDNLAVQEQAETTVVDWNDVSNKYAQMIYAANALQGREGTLTGKLRFDIAPGSTVVIRADAATKSEGIDDLATDIYGFVNRVTVTINAQDASATTAFNLTNLRTAEENDLSRFAMDSHPFYGVKYFNYAPLIPGFEKLTEAERKAI